MFIKHAYNSVSNWAYSHPGKTTSIICVTADLGWVVSGLTLKNWGRVAGGAIAAIADAPVVVWGDREKPKNGADLQDAPLKDRIKEYWKFWKYPWEFQSLLSALLCNPVMLLFSGPDTVSGIGELTDAQNLISNDSFRPGETLASFMWVSALYVTLLKEKEHTTPSPESKSGPHKSLTEKFMAAAAYPFHLANDAWHNGISAAWRHLNDDISEAGPLKVAAWIYAAALPHYAYESYKIGDAMTLTTCALFAVASYYMAKSTKRAALEEKPQSLPKNRPDGPKLP